MKYLICIVSILVLGATVQSKDMSLQKSQAKKTSMKNAQKQKRDIASSIEVTWRNEPAYISKIESLVRAVSFDLGPDNVANDGSVRETFCEGQDSKFSINLIKPEKYASIDAVLGNAERTSMRVQTLGGYVIISTCRVRSGSEEGSNPCDTYYLNLEQTRLEKYTRAYGTISREMDLATQRRRERVTMSGHDHCVIDHARLAAERAN